MTNLDLLLVNPTLDYEEDNKYYEMIKIEDDIPRLQPAHIGVSYLLANCKKQGISVKYIDMMPDKTTSQQLLEYVGKTRPSVVGFTTWTIRMNAAGLLAGMIKDAYPDTVICAGGSHATAIPRETLKEFPAFDFILRGEGELVLPKVFQTKDYSSLKGIVTRDKEDLSYDRIQDIDSLAFPAWEEFDLSKYPGCDPHQTNLELPMNCSRGCFGHCVFCATALGRKRVSRSVESITSEMERNVRDFGAQAITFQDDTMLHDLDLAEELMSTIRKKGLEKKLKWSCSVRVDNKNPDIFKSMKAAGCYYVYVGMESADDEMLKRCGKGTKVEQIRNTVGWIKAAGLVPSGSFILGLPGETWETAQKSIRLGEELNLYSTPYPIAVPFPGSPLSKMVETGQYGLRLLPGADNWDNYGKQFPGIMESENLSIDQLRALQKEAYERVPKKKIKDFLPQENPLDE